MLESKIFYTDTYKKLEYKIKAFLNEQDDFLSPSTKDSTRAVGESVMQ